MLRTLLLPFLAWAGKLRFPTLFKLTAGLFLVTFFLPDPVLFLDEVLLGLAALVLARWKSRKDPELTTAVPPLVLEGRVIPPTMKS